MCLWLKRLLYTDPTFGILNRIKLDPLVSDRGRQLGYYAGNAIGPTTLVGLLLVVGVEDLLLQFVVLE